jgi:hypothetical protein
MVLLRQSQILCKELRLCRSVVCKTCEVEVGKRPTWEKIAGKHLTYGLYVETESGDTILSTKEQGEDKGEAQRKKVSPAGQGRLRAC